MRIYLDNAATSWPKPDAVYVASDDWQRRVGAASGRGVTREANETDRLIRGCRQTVARLIGIDEPRRIIFTQNGTDSLNLALHGLLRPGDHVVTTVCEHNSVLRPLAWLKEHRDVATTLVSCDGQGFVNPDEIRRAITPRTRLIVLNHVSNVTGAIQPAEAIGRIAAEYGVNYLLDAAQSLGHVPTDVRKIGCQLLAAPGHKGLLGPLGTGILYVGPGVEQSLFPVRQGGTGSESELDRQPDMLPDRYEAGNLNVPGIAGLAEGIAEVHRRSLADIGLHQSQLVAQLLEGLAGVPALSVYGPKSPIGRSAVVSFNLDSWDPQELATVLDSQWSIQTRAGLHCAPRMHAALGTMPAGTVRASLGAFNTERDVAALIDALRALGTQ
jgi:cysteine desulfurase / selenocysteine lyase